MAISLSFFPVLSLLLVSLATLSSAKVVTHDFNITWVQANPDGKFSRPTIGINGAWPLPVIRVDVGDNLIVNVNNQLGNQTTTLHWHGIYMNGTSHMDGAMQVSQCGINPGSKFTYNFTVCQIRAAAVTRCLQLTKPRLISQEHTGTTPTQKDNTQVWHPSTSSSFLAL
jgi:iron transport multicopper oxidase